MLKSKQTHVLKASWINTSVGSMIAVGDDISLYALHFADKENKANLLQQLQIKFNAAIIQGVTPPILSIQQELTSYFAGTLTTFKTPLQLSGTPFQQRVWQELMKIAHGTTISYTQLATGIGQPAACRAVANANGANRLAIIIPCHRVINSNSKLGGYAGGIHYKQWLIEHELMHRGENMYAHDQMLQTPPQSD